MSLTIHIIIACLGLISSSLAFFLPSKSTLTTSYGLFAATLISGMVVTMLAPATFTHMCISGVVYSAIIYTILALSRRRLVRHTSI